MQIQSLIFFLLALFTSSTLTFAAPGRARAAFPKSNLKLTNIRQATRAQIVNRAASRPITPKLAVRVALAKQAVMPICFAEGVVCQVEAQGSCCSGVCGGEEGESTGVCVLA
jgi:hypothetical protein